MNWTGPSTQSTGWSPEDLVGECGWVPGRWWCGDEVVGWGTGWENALFKGVAREFILSAMWKTAIWCLSTVHVQPYYQPRQHPSIASPVSIAPTSQDSIMWQVGLLSMVAPGLLYTTLFFTLQYVGNTVTGHQLLLAYDSRALAS